MNQNPTLRNRWATRIPVLNDIVSRGAKAPPMDDIDRVLTGADEDTDTPASPDDIGSESPTVLPGHRTQADIPAEPEKAFSLDELTDIPIPVTDDETTNTDIPAEPEEAFSLDELTDVPIPVSDDETINEIIEQAMPLLMSELEKVARETLKEIIESQADDEEDTSSA